MNRRVFLTGLGTMALAALPLAAWAEPPRGFPAGERLPVHLIGQGGGWLVEHLVLSDGRQALGQSFRHGADIWYEQRFDLSGALGGVFRTPFARRWEDAVPLGAVDLVPGARMLVARVPDVAALSGVGGTTLGAGAYSWDLPGRLAAVPLPPAAGVAGRAAGQVALGADGRILLRMTGLVAQV